MKALYVESCGFSQEYDYRWLRFREQTQERTDKENLPAILIDALNLVDSETFSVVLARQDGELLLLVTGLEPKKRLDFVDRQIRIAVAWVGEDEADSELALRNLAARALEPEGLESLTTAISQAVTLGGEQGFQTDVAALLALAEQHKGTELVAENPSEEIADRVPEPVADRVPDRVSEPVPDTVAKRAKTSPERKRELAAELRQYPLPVQPGVLVVVTGIKKEDTLREAGVWRGLSTLVKTEDWTEDISAAKKSGILLELVGLGLAATALLGFLAKFFKIDTMRP